jgi:hypothetical protein
VASALGDESEQNYRVTLRRILLAITLLGVVGLGIELLLTEHYEKRWQIVPLVLLGMALVSVIAVTWWPSDTTVRVMRIVMAFCVVSAPLGIWLHYSGNVEWELERKPQMRGTTLIWEAVRGATPLLAPGAMAQLGLLGLAFTFRHPALRRRSGDLSSQERT